MGNCPYKARFNHWDFGYIVTNLSRPAKRVVAFYNRRGTAELYIKKVKGAIKWTCMSCRTFAANAAARMSASGAIAGIVGESCHVAVGPGAVINWQGEVILGGVQLGANISAWVSVAASFCDHLNC